MACSVDSFLFLCGMKTLLSFSWFVVDTRKRFVNNAPPFCKDVNVRSRGGCSLKYIIWSLV